MKKLRRVLALIGAILLIGMYLATMLYAIQLVARVFSGKNQKEAFRKAEAEQKASENKENKAGRRK